MAYDALLCNITHRHRCRQHSQKTNKMKEFSFIDKEKKDFLRDSFDEVIIVHCNNWEEAEEWLLNNGEHYGWTNTGVHFYNWEEQFPN